MKSVSRSVSQFAGQSLGRSGSRSIGQHGSSFRIHLIFVSVFFPFYLNVYGRNTTLRPFCDPSDPVSPGRPACCRCCRRDLERSTKTPISVARTGPIRLRRHRICRRAFKPSSSSSVPPPSHTCVLIVGPRADHHHHHHHHHQHSGSMRVRQLRSARSTLFDLRSRRAAACVS